MDGFRDGAGYDAGRPGYPPAAIDALAGTFGLGPGTEVLDLAAGTGKLTRQLAPLGVRITAVEPSAPMLDELRRQQQDVIALAGSAEAIPLPDDSVDAVLVAQAFHWFDAPVALTEIARVLRPGGGLGIVWNARDESVAWVRELSDAYGWRTRRPYPPRWDVRPVVTAGSAFVAGERRGFRFKQALDRDGLLARVRSTSYIAAASEQERERLMAPVETFVARLPEPIELPYETDLFTFTRASTGA